MTLVSLCDAIVKLWPNNLEDSVLNPSVSLCENNVEGNELSFNILTRRDAGHVGNKAKKIK